MRTLQNILWNQSTSVLKGALVVYLPIKVLRWSSSSGLNVNSSFKCFSCMFWSWEGILHVNILKM